MPVLGKEKKKQVSEKQENGSQEEPLHPEPGTRAGRKRIKAERKKLRRELREKGIRSRTDFESIASDLGLTLDNGKRSGFMALLRFRWTNIAAVMGLKGLLLASAAVLTALFLIAALTDKAGSFTVNLTADMLNSGFVLADTRDFSREESRLFSKEIDAVNNISFEDINPDVDEKDGAHNEDNYIAYTFYIKNVGKNTASYVYYLNLDSQTQNVASAIWIMLFEDDKQIVYAKESADGNPEELYGFKNPPFGDSAYYYDKQYYEENGKYGIKTTPFANDETVAQGMVDNVEVGDIHKYTVVIWVEGNDPECTDAIFGGYAKFSMKFDKGNTTDSKSIFKGVYRTEYSDYASQYGDKAETDKNTATASPSSDSKG